MRVLHARRSARVANFVESGQSQGYLLPPDMRECVPEDDLSHFVLEAVNRAPTRPARTPCPTPIPRGSACLRYYPRR